MTNNHITTPRCQDELVGGQEGEPEYQDLEAFPGEIPFDLIGGSEGEPQSAEPTGFEPAAQKALPLEAGEFPIDGLNPTMPAVADDSAPVHSTAPEVMVPMGDWRHARLKNLSATDKRRDNSHVGSGFGKNISNWVGRDMAYPSNVLHLATEASNKCHSATFPKALPEWFIKLFTAPGDWVLDPFTGSGTTNIVAWQLGRNSVGIDTVPKYVALSKACLAELRKEI